MPLRARSRGKLAYGSVMQAIWKSVGGGRSSGLALADSARMAGPSASAAAPARRNERRFVSGNMVQPPGENGNQSRFHARFHYCFHLLQSGARHLERILLPVV